MRQRRRPRASALFGEKERRLKNQRRELRLAPLPFGSAQTFAADVAHFVKVCAGDSSTIGVPSVT